MEKIIKIVDSMNFALALIAFGVLGLIGSRLAGANMPRLLSLEGLYFGICSAGYWARSAAISYERSPGVFLFGKLTVNDQDLRRYLQTVGAVNTSAAICSGFCAFFSALAGYLA